jgi:hypothetical protein
MRTLMALVVLFCGVVSADAAEPEKWCTADRTVLTQTEAGYFLDGKRVEVEREFDNEWRH